MCAWKRNSPEPVARNGTRRPVGVTGSHQILTGSRTRRLPGSLRKQSAQVWDRNRDAWCWHTRLAQGLEHVVRSPTGEFNPHHVGCSGCLNELYFFLILFFK